jgi:hypothetical protein
MLILSIKEQNRRMDRRMFLAADSPVFPTAKGGDGHFLRRLKRLAKGAGLSCGNSRTKFGGTATSERAFSARTALESNSPRTSFGLIPPLAQLPS